jgi:hypothetical protein
VKNTLHPKIAVSRMGADTIMDKVHTRITTYQGEAGREAHAGHGPGDRDHALLERLAQRLARGPGELRQLVEEQHAVVRQRS